MSTKVVTGKVRFSYAHVFTPTAIDEGADPKYSVNLIISKDDTTTIEKIEEAVEAAKQLGKTSKWNGKLPPKLKLPLRDGDEERPDDENYENCYFINASSRNKPGIVDRNRDELMTKEEFYSGCFGRVSINFYPFNVSGNKGIAAGLNNLQKLEDGEPLAGGTSAAEDFAEDFDDDLM